MKINDKLIPKPKILYLNNNGSNTTITLNDNVSNYDYLEIFYTDNNKTMRNSVKVWDFNGKDISLYFFLNYKNDSGIFNYIYCKKVNASGNKLTKKLETYMQIKNTSINQVYEADYIYITKVLGYK